MVKNEYGIGVIDGGVGGFTVLKELIKLYPHETYVYCGDSKNSPYSTKSKEDALMYIREMVDFLEKKNVKAVVIACNAISSLIDEFKKYYKFPIIDIITPAAKAIAKMDKERVTVFSTALTEKMGLYPQKIHELNKKMLVHAEVSSSLPELINDGMKDKDTIEKELRRCLNHIEEKYGKDATVVLACTHFPLVENMMKELKPDMSFFNPAICQAEAIKDIEIQIKTDMHNRVVSVYTNGDIDVYKEFLTQCEIPVPYTVNYVDFKGGMN